LTRFADIINYLLVISLLLSIWAGDAGAVLGGNAASIDSDAHSLTVATVTRTSGMASNAPSVEVYTVERMATVSGINVNEYLGSDGRVFAVSWRGMRPPNLAVLLGTYFKQYTEAAKAGGLTARGLHHASVRGNDVEVEMAGHMRDMWGRAILPAMLPPGVNKQEIR